MNTFLPHPPPAQSSQPPQQTAIIFLTLKYERMAYKFSLYHALFLSFLCQGILGCQVPRDVQHRWPESYHSIGKNFFHILLKLIELRSARATNIYRSKECPRCWCQLWALDETCCYVSFPKCFCIYDRSKSSLGGVP